MSLIWNILSCTSLSSGFWTRCGSEKNFSFGRRIFFFAAFFGGAEGPTVLLMLCLSFLFVTYARYTEDELRPSKLWLREWIFLGRSPIVPNSNILSPEQSRKWRSQSGQMPRSGPGHEAAKGRSAACVERREHSHTGSRAQRSSGPSTATILAGGWWAGGRMGGWAVGVTPPKEKFFLRSTWKIQRFLFPSFAVFFMGDFCYIFCPVCLAFSSFMGSRKWILGQSWVQKSFLPVEKKFFFVFLDVLSLCHFCAEFWPKSGGCITFWPKHRPTPKPTVSVWAQIWSHMWSLCQFFPQIWPQLWSLCQLSNHIRAQIWSLCHFFNQIWFPLCHVWAQIWGEYLELVTPVEPDLGPNPELVLIFCPYLELVSLFGPNLGRISGPTRSLLCPYLNRN